MRRDTTADRGTTLVETIATLVLVSVVVGAILTLLGQHVQASVRHRDAASATTWLQNSAEYLQLVPLELCGDRASVMDAYQDTVRANVASPAGWPAANIAVTDVRFWGDDEFGSTCTDRAQLVTLVATSPRLVRETLEVVMGNALGGDDGIADQSSACRFSRLTFRDKKSGLVQTSPLVTLPLKKPSTTKPSELRTRSLRVTLEMSGTCSGELRLRYRYPHKDHFHWRTVRLRLAKGQTTVYSGKFGRRSEKYLTNAVVDVRVEQGRSRRKVWGVVNSGDLRGLVVTQ